jgi:hypothetical protein
MGLPAEAVDVIAHPAALLPPDAAAASEQAVTDDSCTVLFFGRIWPYKGLDVLIRAEPRISERIPGLRIVIAGEGEPFERYEKLMIDPARFTVINRFVSEAEVGTLFRKATVVVLPYLEASQSGVIPVAYFHGKPVVVTDVGGLPEAVHDGETGFVVPAGDEVRLADAVVRILSDDDLRLRMGANARMLADAWSPEHVAERTTRVYEKVVGRVSADPTVTDTVLRLHRYLKSSHWRDDALIGPDCGVRFNYRAGRFVKSALPSLPWHDDRYYLQAQGYWIIANWRLADALGQDFADIAVRCSDEVVRRQTPDGAWEYPNPAWKGRIATAEGTWAALGLLETYSHTRDDAYLESALRWHHYLDNEIAWLPVGGGIAVNYFANRAAPAVPNNTAFVLRFLGELAHATDDERWLSRTDGLATFLAEAQRPTGEMPYELDAEGTRLEHFQCFQYNAFQLLDLIRYEECTNDRSLRPTSEGMARFLANAVGADGTHPHDCRHRKPTVTYHSAAIAAALAAADDAGLHAGGRAVARQIWSTVSKAQRADGSFPHSRGDHVVLRDRRSYPRNLAMILTHGLSMDGPASDHIHSSRSVQ